MNNLFRANKTLSVLFLDIRGNLFHHSPVKKISYLILIQLEKSVDDSMPLLAYEIIK